MKNRKGAPSFSLDALSLRVDELRALIPPQGLSIPAFESLVLADVSPSRTHEAVRGLHNRRAIYVRRNRFDARVFSSRPPRLAGALRRLDPVDAFLAAAIPHIRWLEESLVVLGKAKPREDFIVAREARHNADAASARVVKAARSHVERGMNFGEARRAMHSLFSTDVLRALMVFEPSFEPGAEALWSSVAPPKARRIPNGLKSRDKIFERIKRAQEGMTKTAVMRAIRPKLTLTALDDILTALRDEGLIEEKLPPRRDRRLGTRFFVTPTQ